jgi:DNA-binding NtrC family response regulator
VNIVYVDDSDHYQMHVQAAVDRLRELHPTWDLRLIFVTLPSASDASDPLFLSEIGRPIGDDGSNYPEQVLKKTVIDELAREPANVFLLDVLFDGQGLHDYGARLARYLNRSGVQRERILLFTIAPETVAVEDDAWFYRFDKTHFRERGTERLAFFIAGLLEHARRALLGTVHLPARAANAVGLYGEHPAWLRVLDEATRAARFDTRGVLLRGPSGSGKEGVARLIHAQSTRSQQPFITINCGALPEAQIEAELFGIVRNAAPGVPHRSGKFLEADGGRLFLDEIGELEYGMQARLLRALDPGEIQPVGGAPRRVDVVVVAATNKDLQKAIAAGSFREELYHRLNVIEIELPHLRDRGQDALLIARRFLENQVAQHGIQRRLSDEVCELILNYRWPGEVRELKNAIERAYILADGDVISREYLPPALTGGHPVDPLRVQDPSPAAPIAHAVGAPLTRWQRACDALKDAKLRRNRYTSFAVALRALTLKIGGGPGKERGQYAPLLVELICAAVEGLPPSEIAIGEKDRERAILIGLIGHRKDAPRWADAQDIPDAVWEAYRTYSQAVPVVKRWQQMRLGRGDSRETPGDQSLLEFFRYVVGTELRPEAQS